MSKRKLTKMMVFVIVLAVLIVGTIAYYLLVNEAPITKGKVETSISYNDSHKLDLYLPTQRLHSKAPVLIYIHGGAWIGGTKSSVNFNRFNGAFNRLRSQGYAIVSPDYTLARHGNSPFPDCFQDVYQAYQWVIDHADEYDFDLDNIGVLGESAGGHIAMMTIFADASVADTSFDMPRVNYFIDVYGPNDLEKLYHMQMMDTMKAFLAKLPEPLSERLNFAKHLFGFDPETDPERASALMKKYSPNQYLNAQIPPTLMIHGTSDRVVPVDQSRELSKAMNQIGIDNEVHLLEGVDHAFRGATDQQKGQVQDWIVDFVHQHYNWNE